MGSYSMLLLYMVLWLYDVEVCVCVCVYYIYIFEYYMLRRCVISYTLTLALSYHLSYPIYSLRLLLLLLLT